MTVLKQKLLEYVVLSEINNFYTLKIIMKNLLQFSGLILKLKTVSNIMMAIFSKISIGITKEMIIFVFPVRTVNNMAFET